uniref:SSD domain-containing protein n=1 Tax=Ciona savignyi TaxID=51511 RepID=H2Z0N8_CIOSA
RYALKLRSFLHRVLFKFGCWIQRNAAYVLIIGILALAGCCICLKFAHMETNISKLWVETGGKLEEELKYTADKTTAAPGSTTSDYTLQMLMQAGHDTADIDSMTLHLKAAVEATKVTVVMYNQTWSFDDVCYKQSIPSDEDSSISFILSRVFPCFIIGPLDCFWDGSKLLGPNPPIYLNPTMSDLTWKSMNPIQLINIFRESLRDTSIASELNEYYELMSQAGITTGYTEKWCLDPMDPDCPTTAANYNSREIPDVKTILKAGCSGFASKVMQWPLDLIVGGVQKNTSGYIERARGLQTLFQLMGGTNMYNFHKTVKGGPNWSMSRANAVLLAWQRKFADTIYSIQTGESRDELHAFTEAAATDILNEFSNVSTIRVVGGYLLMNTLPKYAHSFLHCVAFLKLNCYYPLDWLRLLIAHEKQGVKISGPSWNTRRSSCRPISLLVPKKLNQTLTDLICFYQYCVLSLLNLQTASDEIAYLSLQVLPFLMLGLGVDDMFLMAHHFGEIAVLSYIPFDERTGECLKRVGVSVSLTSVAILSGFLFSLIIPMPALRAFGLQASVVTVFNLFSVLVIFPSILSLDLERRRQNKLDIFFCFDREHPRTPPPRYTSNIDDAGPKKVGPSPNRPRVAFVNTTESSAPYTTRSSSGQVILQPLTRKGSDNQQSCGQNHAHTYLHSILYRPNRGIRLKLHKTWARSGSMYACLATLPSLTISQLAERYYAPFLLKNPVRIVVLFLFGGILGLSIYGTTIVKDGLDLGDVLPRGTREHDAIVVQTTYFSFFNMYIVTKEFDYASQQQNLYDLHSRVGNISYVMRQTDNTLTKFWLQYMRDWLADLQQNFDEAWTRGHVNASTWMPQASDKTVLAYKLLLQTGRAEKPTDPGRIVRLVLDDGLIPEDAFYNYLSAWVGNDPLSYAAAQASIKPNPAPWKQKRDANLIIPRSQSIEYAQMPFYLNGLQENADFVSVIKSVRSVCETMTTSDFKSYPSGYPFTFWQQYIDLRYWLFVSLGCVIGAVFVVLSIVLFNPWAAAIMALFLAMIATELLGFMGAAGVKLSAVPAVILVASIGLGVEFTVHITFAFITSCGSRRERVVQSIGHMTGPVVDGAVSTLLGVVMLAGSEFDFIIKYFFQVLGILILLGVLNGLVLLPVVLSLIGPPPE